MAKPRPPVSTPQGRFLPLVTRPGGSEAERGVLLPPGVPADLTGATAAAAGDGIQFDTDNEGGWLDIQTNDVDGGGRGMDIRDQSGGGIAIQVLDGGEFTLAGEWIDIFSQGGPDPFLGVGLYLWDGSSDGLHLRSGADGFSTDLELKDGTGLTLDLQTSESLIIKDSGGTPVFQVDEDGTITPSTSGIAFSTANSGGYLQVTTTSSSGGYGIRLTADVDGIGLFSGSPATSVQAVTGTGIAAQIRAGEKFQILNSSGVATLEIANGLDVIFTMPTGQNFSVKNHLGGTLFVQPEAGGIDFNLPASTSFHINDSLGNPMFEAAEGSDVAAWLPSGGSFLLLDSGGFPVLRMNDGDPNLYIKTGGILSPTL